MLWSAAVQAAPTFQEVKTAYTPSDAWLLARDGRVLQQVRLDKHVRRLTWTPLTEISPALLRALIYSEDKRFYAHSGVDWNAVSAAAWGNLWNTKTRGASTLTMQLSGLLEEGTNRNKRRNVLEKAGQAGDALWLDTRWNKAQILEAYLNLVSFRGELQGVAAMSWGLFGKAPSGLNEREAALAAVLIRAPQAKPMKAAERACVLLKALQRSQQCPGLEGFAALHLQAPFEIKVANNAPHLALSLLKKPGQRLKTSLDFDLQHKANQSLRSNLLQLAERNVQDGAVVVLDNQSGEILAWVGSSGGLSQAPEVDAVVASRQAGSTLKPFLYALAIEQRQLTAASILDDSPINITTTNGLYVPQNYDKNFVGPVSLRMALGSSLNVPAVRTLLRVGGDGFYQRLKMLGLETLRENSDYYGYSLALGSADVSLLQLTNAYRALANDGEWRATITTPSPSLGKAETRRVYTPQAAFIVSDILSDRTARFHTFGLDSALATRYWAAVKTGTSKDMRDNWCVGFSRKYTVGVWVGNAGGEPMHDVSGVSGAAPVWLEMMDTLHRRQGDVAVRSDAPLRPVAVEARQIRFEPALEPARKEYFLSGTGQDLIQANNVTLNRLGLEAESNRLQRIAYPGAGTIIALDPDIPPDNQRVIFKVSGSLPRGWQWRLDSKIVGDETWFPLPGKHILQLLDSKGEIVDGVSFEVRGAVFKKGAMR